MHINATTVVITIAVFIIGVACWAFEALCHYLDRRDQQHLAVAYEARHDARAPRQLPADPFDWAATEAIAELERERLATTGELRALYERPYPGQVSDTDQLRALALEGDADTITGIIETWKADNL
jgi:hypothetical protein